MCGVSWMILQAHLFPSFYLATQLRSHPKGVKRADLSDKYALDADATKKTLEGA